MPYEFEVKEDAPIGSTVFAGIHVTDLDTVGQSIEVECASSLDTPFVCDTFVVESLSSSHNSYLGVLVLKQPLDYTVQQYYTLILKASVRIKTFFLQYCHLLL